MADFESVQMASMVITPSANARDSLLKDLTREPQVDGQHNLTFVALVKLSRAMGCDVGQLTHGLPTVLPRT